MNRARLITCGTVIEAHMIKGRLDREGIECVLINQNFTNLLPLYNNVLGGGIQVLVSEADYDEARRVIQDKLSPEKGELRCPCCGSSDIVLGLGENRGLKILNLLIGLLFAIPLGHMKPKYYCKTCKKEIK